MSPIDWPIIEAAIAAATGEVFHCVDTQCVAGGCINEAFRISGGGRQFFVKTNAATLSAMFAAEADGLNEIRATHSLRTPRPICSGIAGDSSYLVLEHIVFHAPSASSQEKLGEQLALMHSTTSDQFGWKCDNTIGSTAQCNTRTKDWLHFLRERRLGWQLQLAHSNGAPSSLLDQGWKLLDLLPAFFTNYQVQPSLLHGDLWGGNWSSDDAGQPVIFDPAVYYGDRETDLAMTELFGGFSDRFYCAYQNAWACDAGYSTRKELYNLYHVINHFNLFAGTYASQAQRMVERLLAEIS